MVWFKQNARSFKTLGILLLLITSLLNIFSFKSEYSLVFSTVGFVGVIISIIITFFGKHETVKKTKKKPKIKHANISNTRMLLNQIAFSFFSFALGLLLIIIAAKSIYDGYVLTPTDYRVESNVYFLSTSPFSYLFNLLFYLGGGIFFLVLPYLSRDMFPRKKEKKLNKKVQRKNK
jgi:Na+/melibiose symporter-like transporter